MLHDITFIKMYVSNIIHAEYFFSSAFNFRKVFEYQEKEENTLYTTLKSNAITLVLASSSNTANSIKQLTDKKGDHVAELGISCKNLSQTIKHFEKNACTFVKTHERSMKSNPEVFKIQPFPGLTITLMQYEAQNEKNYPSGETEASFKSIDHFAICLEPGDMEKWIKFYSENLGLKVCFTQNINTETSGMKSKVIENDNSKVRLVLLEPLNGKKKSQIQHFLDHNHGPGVQHFAIQTSNIIAQISRLKKLGINFLKPPSSFYKMTKEKKYNISQSMDHIEELGIVIDKEECGYLLQCFSKPIQTFPTFFIEIIQRCGAEMFGGDNIKALFESIELDQLKTEALA